MRIAAPEAKKLAVELNVTVQKAQDGSNSVTVTWSRARRRAPRPHYILEQPLRPNWSLSRPKVRLNCLFDILLSQSTTGSDKVVIVPEGVSASPGPGSAPERRTWAGISPSAFIKRASAPTEKGCPTLLTFVRSRFGRLSGVFHLLNRFLSPAKPPPQVRSLTRPNC